MLAQKLQTQTLFIHVFKVSNNFFSLSALITYLHHHVMKLLDHIPRLCVTFTLSGSTGWFFPPERLAL